MPHSTGHALRNVRRRAVIVGSAVAATTIIGAVFLASYNRVERYVTLTTQLDAFARSASGLHALEWQAVAEGDVGEETSERIRGARSRFLQARRALGDNPNDPLLLALTEAYGPYVASMDRMTQLLATGERRPLGTEGLVAMAAYERVDVLVQRAKQEALARELDSLRRLQGWTLGLLLFGTVAAVLGSLRAFSTIEHSEERYRALSEHATDLLWIVDAGGRVIYRTPSVVNTVVGAADDRPATLWEAVHPDTADEVRAFIADLVAHPGAPRTFEGRFRGRADRDLYLEVLGRNLLQNRSVRGIVLNARDISERKEHEDALRKRALHDGLTGLPNRVLLLDRVTSALSAAGHQPDLIFAVIFIDLDGFKAVNDSFGHAVGDELLAAVATRLASTLRIIGRALPSGARRPPGTDTLARVGGDEFVVLLNHSRSATNALAAANRLLSELQRPFAIGGQDVMVSASLGVTTGPGAYSTADELLRDADTAMYRAKAAGGSKVHMFDDAMQQTAVRSLALKAGLRLAVEREEFSLLYQPIVELDTGRFHACEALVRWNHRDGVVVPSDFIHLAEETGLIVPLGRWVMSEACRQAAAWRREFPDLPPGIVSVNVSAKELAQPNFIADFDHVVSASGARPDDITVELTESVTMQDPEGAIAKIELIRARGHRVSMDDFGTGHSSLSYFHRLPMDILKVDQSFVSDIETSTRALGAVRLMVDMARQVGMKVIAEGIETPGQLALLSDVGCTLGQGYAFARPLEPDALRDRFLRLNNRVS
jgi:diguanylate cyclase (GGDEF)-like protein/PAS domain S-box-containing protein